MIGNSNLPLLRVTSQWDLIGRHAQIVRGLVILLTDAILKVGEPKDRLQRRNLLDLTSGERVTKSQMQMLQGKISLHLLLPTHISSIPMRMLLYPKTLTLLMISPTSLLTLEPQHICAMIGPTTHPTKNSTTRSVSGLPMIIPLMLSVLATLKSTPSCMASLLPAS